MAQPTSPPSFITVTPLASLIVRTAYYTLLDVRREPLHPEPTVLDFLVAVHGLTGWVMAQQALRARRPQNSIEDIERYLWGQEAQRNKMVLTERWLLDKSSKRWLDGQRWKEEQQQRKKTGAEGLLH
ncbi:hypothetical protein EPUS_00905 [Endocarpon pusillum Z07020]|uniref:Uncharacterized protein n=1 Tax=Endocarpon pusillum (strain Z07020 / HMAS-L-300199) TaxID=1263415 RepID=U1G8A5_ENDPU|nr:uncharacterized protein EPUS_00905 [Endocarpon pusillum Z07020]ERF73652.1 hypothetical protein EPUS_00905 [Endocarpon pusillum Z07020]